MLAQCLEDRIELVAHIGETMAALYASTSLDSAPRVIPCSFAFITVFPYARSEKARESVNSGQEHFNRRSNSLPTVAIMEAPRRKPSPRLI